MDSGAGNTNSAEALVREVSKQIGFIGEGVDKLCSAMRSEFVMESWQLSYVDSFQWRDLAAPVGVVVAIRQKLNGMNHSASSLEPDSQIWRQNTNTPKSVAHSVRIATEKEGEDDFLNNIRKNSAKAERPCKRKKTKMQQMEGSRKEMVKVVELTKTGVATEEDDCSYEIKPADLESSSSKRGPLLPLDRSLSPKVAPRQELTSDDKFLNEKMYDENNELSEEARQINKAAMSFSDSALCFSTEEQKAYEGGAQLKPPGMMDQIKSQNKIIRFFDMVFPFDHQGLWKRALFHAMPSNHLQQYVLNTSEMWFICATLFTGIVSSLWEAFPDVSDDASLGIVAILFNCTEALTILLSVGATISYGVLYVVCGAVHPKAFKQFFLVAKTAMQLADFWLVSTFYFFMLLVAICLYARNRSIIAETGMGVNSFAVSGGTMALVMVSFLIGVYYISSLSRAAFHGGFLAEDKRKDRTSTSVSMIETADCLECKELWSALNSLNPASDEVLNRYMYTQQLKGRSIHEAPGVRLLHRHSCAAVFQH